MPQEWPKGWDGQRFEGGVEAVEQRTLKRPSFYVVVVHNDPVTPRSFVVEVLKKFFHKPDPEATRIMLLAFNFGVGIVAKYTHEIAETKARQVNEYARGAGYPLLFSVEKE